MIPEEQLKEIKKQLDQSENPLFFYDDDGDGLCSFLLFRRYLGRGKGIAIRGKPMVSSEFLRYVTENMPDKIFVLDKPFIDQEFIDAVNVPIIWIDHHNPVEREGVKYYNPKLKNDKSKKNVAYWCYQIVKQDMWIAGIGCISDWYLPDFFKELKKQYKDLFNDEKTPEGVLYNTKFGELCRLFNFLLKGRVSVTNNSVRLLTKIKDPYDLINPNTKESRLLHKRIESIKKEYDNLLRNALKIKPDKLFLYKYKAHKFSLTAELSNELIYKFPKKVIIVGREKDDRIKMSLRSSKLDLRPIIEEALVGVDGYGGGHAFACAANIPANDFDNFVNVIRKHIA